MNHTHILNGTLYGRGPGTRCTLLKNSKGIHMAVLFDDGIEELSPLVSLGMFLTAPVVHAGDIFERKSDPSEIWVCHSVDGVTATVVLMSVQK